MKALVFLDMDGVIADFVGGITSLHGRPSPYSDPKNFGEFHMDKIWGMTAEEFWAPLNQINSFDFWANLNPTPEAHDIVDLLSSRCGVENICILTSPTLDSGCIPGKRAWTARHFPQLAKNMLFGSAKQFLAGPGRILVDDKDANIKAFREYGGYGVTVPRPWNMLQGTDKVVTSILQQIDVADFTIDAPVSVSGCQRRIDKLTKKISELEEYKWKYEALCK